MANSMSHLKFLLADGLIYICLQVMGIPLDSSIKLQLAALVGSMLAIRTIDGKKRIWDWLRVAFSGMVVANFLGLYICEEYDIPLRSFKALFLLWLLGILSDVLIRILKLAGEGAITYTPMLIKALFDFAITRLTKNKV